MKNLTKKSLALILVLLMLSSVLGICAENKPDKVYKLRLAHIYTDDHPYTIECRNIAEKIKQKTNNAVEITVYPAAQLGGEPDITNNVMIGAIDMAVVGIGELAKRANDLNIFEAPYIFETYEDGVKALENPDIVANFNELEKNFGMRVLTGFYYGVRHLTSNFPVNSPDDMLNKKIRVPNHAIPMYIAEYMMTAKPTPMNLSEVYMALQQGVVDAQENPIPTIYTQKFFEVQEYINLTGHQMTITPVIISTKVLKDLPEEYAKIIEEEFKAGKVDVDNALMKQEEELLDKMIAEGVKVHEPENLQAFKDNVPEVIERCENEGKWSKGLYDIIKGN
ncbi:MAG TPA: TRAP transporter substrate-binding protein DctP [Christensenellaceae bacterium]|nr:TRAP transporter substrate-binding protein DctP [Christensenellaceae bacterium]